MIDLLPCPFCGSPAELDTHQGYRALVSGRIGNRVVVYCLECSADMGVCREDVPEVSVEALVAEIVAAWNRRTIQAHRDEAYQNGWNDGYAEGYGKRLVNLTEPFSPKPPDADEMIYVAAHRDTLAALGVETLEQARAVIEAARAILPACEAEVEARGDEDDCYGESSMVRPTYRLSIALAALPPADKGGE